MDKTTFSREELYEVIWSVPLLQLSKQYNISDVGLRKICLRMKIPLPKSGHWSKLKYGKEVKRLPLTTEYEGEKEVTLSLRADGDERNEMGISPQKALQRTIEYEHKQDLIIPKQLASPDPLVAKVHKSLTSKLKKHHDNSLLYLDSDCLDITISSEQVDRALILMDTFIKTMNKRGHRFLFENRKSYIIVSGEKFEMKLKESTKRSEDMNSLGMYDFTPTGNLSFRFKAIWRMVNCNDGKFKIEEQFPSLIARLEILGKQLEEERIQQEKNKIKREEKERLEREQEKRRSIEFKAFRGLMLESRRWNEAKLIRQYIAEVELQTMEKDKANPEFQDWLEWAKKKADWFDPFTEIQDDYLLKSDRDSIMNTASQDMSTSLSSYSTHESFPNRHHWPFAPWYIRKT